MNERGEQLAAVCRQVFGDKPEKPKAHATHEHRNGDGHPGEERGTAGTARAKNADKFNRLWNGDTSAHGDDRQPGGRRTVQHVGLLVPPRRRADGPTVSAVRVNASQVG